MKTGCDSCDLARAYAMGRIAGFLNQPKEPPADYDHARRDKWTDGYEREVAKRAARHRQDA